MVKGQKRSEGKIGFVFVLFDFSLLVCACVCACVHVCACMCMHVHAHVHVGVCDVSNQILECILSCKIKIFRQPF